MIKFGRYGITFGRVFWLQTTVPVRIKYFLWFSFFKEARPNDIDKEQQFVLGTPMMHEGRKYYYYKAGEDIRVADSVKEEDKHD